MTTAVRVGIVMGSDSDLRVMGAAADVLSELGVEYEVRVVSAHRTPHDMVTYGATAAGRGLHDLVAGAGGAAHLPGMLASTTSLPVIGVPVALAHLDGLDALLSMAQMPAGIPVATVAIDGARNAGLLAARMLAIADPTLRERLDDERDRLADESRIKDVRVQALRPVPTDSVPS
jgi:5-(carboxyamino)imidazole ribonucleotide mutase